MGIFGFNLFECVLLVQVTFLELLIDRPDILARRPEPALHDQLLAFFGQEVVDEEGERYAGLRLFAIKTLAETDGRDDRFERPPFHRRAFLLGRSSHWRRKSSAIKESRRSRRVLISAAGAMSWTLMSCSAILSIYSRPLRSQRYRSSARRWTCWSQMAILPFHFGSSRSLKGSRSGGRTESVWC